MYSLQMLSALREIERMREKKLDVVAKDAATNNATDMIMLFKSTEDKKQEFSKKMPWSLNGDPDTNIHDEIMDMFTRLFDYFTKNFKTSENNSAKRITKSSYHNEKDISLYMISLNPYFIRGIIEKDIEWRAMNNKTENDFHLLDYDICFTAVKKDGMLLQYIPQKFRNQDLLITALLQNGLALQFLENPSESDRVLAVYQNSQALLLIPIDEIQYWVAYIALQTDGMLLLWLIRDDNIGQLQFLITPELIEIATFSSPYVIRYIDRITYLYTNHIYSRFFQRIYTRAVCKKPYLYEFVPDIYKKDDRMCFITCTLRPLNSSKVPAGSIISYYAQAVTMDPMTIMHVPERFTTTFMYNLALGREKSIESIYYGYPLDERNPALRDYLVTFSESLLKNLKMYSNDWGENAIKLNPRALKHVPFTIQTIPFYQKVLKSKPELFECISDEAKNFLVRNGMLL